VAAGLLVFLTGSSSRDALRSDHARGIENKEMVSLGIDVHRLHGRFALGLTSPDRGRADGADPAVAGMGVTCSASRSRGRARAWGTCSARSPGLLIGVRRRSSRLLDEAHGRDLRVMARSPVRPGLVGIR